MNPLSPGSAGLPAPSPSDDSAVQPTNSLAPQAAPSGGGSEMVGHFGSAMDHDAATFGKVKEASGQIDATAEALGHLASLGDTVSMDDLVEAAGGMVAAGIPAVSVAGTLADAPEGPGQLQGWVQEQLQKLAPRQQQMQEALANSGYHLGLSAFRHVLSASAEDHHQRSRLAATSFEGKPN